MGKIEIKYSFKERIKIRFYDFLIDVIKKIILLAISLGIIYFAVSYNVDAAFSDFLIKNVFGISEASFLYNVTSPYIRFFTYASFYEGIKRILPINLNKFLNKVRKSEA
ncbi:MAG: hypothetical protein DRO40_08935 [Thermoprotei archaeon]|nr:MAG: hypothetical protein DRO40_08935 [Thermoprotei archaeon]